MVLLFVLLLIVSPTLIKAQSSSKITSFGSDVGGTLFSNSISSQYHFFARHNISKQLIGEANLGLGFLSNPFRRSRLFSLDYRVLYPLKSLIPGPGKFTSRFTPYLYTGLGIARYKRLNVKVQDDPLLQKSDSAIPNTSFWNNGSGWVAQIPIGIAVDYQLDDMTAIKVSAGYHILAGQSVIGNNAKLEGFLGATVGLKFRPFGSDWDKDGIPTNREMNDILTYPDNPDSDNDGLFDGEELYTYKTDPLNPDSDGDGLSDGQEITKYGTNPLLIDTDGGLVNDWDEVQRGGNPLYMFDDRPLATVMPTKEIKIPSAENVLAYRTFEPLQYETLHYHWKEVSKETLSKVSQLLQVDEELKVKVAGHADKRGNRVMNRSLSNVRSWYVAKYLLEQGIDAQRIHQVGFGEERPSEQNEYAVNRRTEIKLSYNLPLEESAQIDENLPTIRDQVGDSYLIPHSIIQFGHFSDQLSDNGKRWLQALAKFLSNNEKYKIQISASGDNSGSYAVNEMLREARATSVAKFLVNNGISFDRLQITEGPKPEIHKREVTVRKIENVKN